MFYKIAKNTQTEIDDIYEDFVVEIASKVAKKVKGKEKEVISIDRNIICTAYYRPQYTKD